MSLQGFETTQQQPRAVALGEVSHSQIEAVLPRLDQQVHATHSGAALYLVQGPLLPERSSSSLSLRQSPRRLPHWWSYHWPQCGG